MASFIGPGTGSGIDGSRSLAGGVAGFDGEVGAIRETVDVCGCQGAGDSSVVFATYPRGITSENSGIINGGDGQCDGLGCGAAEVVGDGDSEGIVAVEIGIGCVRPGTGFRIDGCRTVGWGIAGFD